MSLYQLERATVNLKRTSQSSSRVGRTLASVCNLCASIPASGSRSGDSGVRGCKGSDRPVGAALLVRDSFGHSR